MRKTLFSILGAACLASAAVPAAHASLTTFKTFTGNVGVSTSGFGSLSNSGTLTANVPAGATILGAYLYTAYFSFSGPVAPSATLGGTPVAFGPDVNNVTACCGIGSARADVTSIVTHGGSYAVTEGDARQDGEALVVVYSDASLPTSTVGILDGFSAVNGDTTSINFANPLDPTAPGFAAEMRLGIGFSCCNQKSTVMVNGTTITNNAGNNDDGQQVANGSLITVGDDNDPFSPLLAAYSEDHERYNLVPQITKGDKSITINTNNPSHDDNIFLAVFDVSGKATINQPVPEPSTMLLLASGLVALAWRKREKI